jgi:hypothetical protein
MIQRHFVGVDLPPDYRIPPPGAEPGLFEAPCPPPAMANERCRMHGAGSTGPRTAEGLARSRRARWKHGLYSAEPLAERKRVLTAISNDKS